MNPRFLRLLLATVCLAAALPTSARAQQPVVFTCAAKSASRLHPLSASTLFPETSNAETTASAVDKLAFGFDLKTAPATIGNGVCESDKPFFFSMAAGDADYRVTVVLGGEKASTTTLRAESRRLLLLEKTVPAGASATESFVINVRRGPAAGPAQAPRDRRPRLG
jgi:hypothetical protein